MLPYDQRQDRSVGKGWSPSLEPETFHLPVCSGCKHFDAQGRKECRHHVIKAKGYRDHASRDGCSGFLFQWLEVRDERQGEARRV